MNSVARKPVKILMSLEARKILEERVSDFSIESEQPMEIVSWTPATGPKSLAGVEVAFFSRDIYEGSTRQKLTARSASFFHDLKISSVLKWLHIFSSGADRREYIDLANLGTIITTSSGASGRSVAVMALTGLLALNKRLHYHIRNQHNRIWPVDPIALYPASLAGQEAVIIGTGHIGSELAKLLKALGMRVVGVNRRGYQADIFDEVESSGRLANIARSAAWLIVCCPLNEGSRNLVDATVLNNLPNNANIINVGRGGVVNQRALTEALSAGSIAGAYLDVFDTEPLPFDSALWAMENVIITPHSAAHSKDVGAAVCELFFENLKRWVSGVSMRNVISFESV